MSEFEKDEKPSRQENEYFARADAEALRKLARKQAEAVPAAERERLKAQHFMKCPRCGFDLHTLKNDQVTVDTCFHCHGVFLHAGELEQILDEHRRGEHRVVEAVLNLFKAAETH
jgi:hypothetical protein